MPKICMNPAAVTKRHTAFSKIFDDEIDLETGRQRVYEVSVEEATHLLNTESEDPRGNIVPLFFNASKISKPKGRMRRPQSGLPSPGEPGYEVIVPAHAREAEGPSPRMTDRVSYPRGHRPAEL